MNEREPDVDLIKLSGMPRELFAEEVFCRYATDLIRIAEERLRPQLRPKVSAEDVVQSAFKSFFRNFSEFSVDPDSPGSLWALLVVITLRKCSKWDDWFCAEKRSLHREIPIHASHSEIGLPQEMMARGPGPQEAAVLVELSETLLNHFPPRQQQMIQLRMEGCSLVEIAERLHSSRRTVSRVLARSKQILTKLIE